MNNIEIEELSRVFKALSSETRVRMVYVLKRHTLCVGALSDRLGISQGAVSQHLHVLREAHLVRPERQSYFVHYRLNEEAFAHWKETVEWFIQTDAENKRASSRKRKEQSMCDSRNKCLRPGELKTKTTAKCSSEQIKKCHHDGKGHACSEKEKRTGK
ncbi:MAG: winged helix-turn-helix transcriptional regulator [Candidatus Lindowbacteria bacterium]|nr:winged helix-turn-helix transcriptional regulator [Candidatus Lindowbacteria bacterium]